MSIKEFFEQALNLNDLIKENERELERLRELSVSVSSPDLTNENVQSSKQNDRIGSTVSLIVDLEAEIYKENERYLQIKKEIRCMINTLNNYKLKLILQKRYLESKKWELIRKELSVSDIRYLFRLHSKALKEIAKKNKNYH